MHKCDFCDIGIAEPDGALVPGSAMLEALTNGYRPTVCPQWFIMYDRIASALNRENAMNETSMATVTQEAVESRWNLFLQSTDRSWRLCSSCFSTLQPYLPLISPTNNRMVDMAQPYTNPLLVPTNVSALAVIAGYLGLLSPLVIFAPFAFVLGILAFRDVNKHPGQRGKVRAVFAITMGLIFTLFGLLGLILILAG